jgi:hypothetical protein
MWLRDNKSCCNLELLILVVISIVLYLSLFMLLRLEIREGLMPYEEMLWFGVDHCCEVMLDACV